MKNHILHSNSNHLQYELLKLAPAQLAQYFVKEIKQYSRNPAQ